MAADHLNECRFLVFTYILIRLFFFLSQFPIKIKFEGEFKLNLRIKISGIDQRC